MPASIAVAAIGAAVSAGAQAVFLGTVFSSAFMSSFASSLVLSGLSALTGGGNSQAAQEPQGSVMNPGRTVTTQQAIQPWRVVYGETRVGGTITYKKFTNNNTRYHLVITLAGHVCEDIVAIYFGDEEVTLDGSGEATGKYAGYVRIKKSLGNESGQPFPDLVSESDGEWTDAHRQTGHCKIYVRLIGHTEKFPMGLPNITVKLKGKNDILDPRTGLRAWTANPALIVNDYLTDTVRGLGAVYSTEISATALTSSANTCDELVTLAAGGTEKRYTCNGSFTTAEKPADILPRLASSMAGYVVKIGGTWDILAGAYETPTLTLTDSDLAGAISWSSLISRRANCNSVKGVYADPGNFWQATDFPAVVSTTAIADDSGEQSWHDLKLDFTNSGSMAQRIAKIDLLRTRQPLTVTFPGKLSAFRARPGRTVMLTIAKYGWSAKPFFIEEGRFAVRSDGTLGYTLVLRETAAAIYDWSTSEEQAVDLAPNTTLADPGTVSAPGVPTVTETLYETTGSAGVKSRATVSWSAMLDQYVLDYLPEYRTAAGTWVALSPAIDTSVQIDDLAPGDYEFRLRARNVFGVTSDYGGTRAQTLLGLTAPPAAVAGFYVIKSAGIARATWQLHADLDVRQGGAIVVRHSPLTSGATWEGSVIVEEFAGNAVSGDLALMTGTYLAKARDSSGNWSTTAASFVVTEGMVTGFTTVATTTQQTAFAGTKTNAAVLSGALQLDSLTTIASMATPISTWGRIASLGGIHATGSYDFDAVVDLSTVATRRFEADVAVACFDTGDLISARDLVSTWSAVSGTAVDDCDATLYVATTNDNPAGSPTWGAWTPFFVADFTCRAAKFKLDLASGSLTHNISVSTLAVDIKVPV